jgi:hypothetical protein
MSRIITIVLLAILTGACGHTYAQNIRPIPGVEPYGGREFRQSTEGGLGMVYAEADGATCDDAIAKAFTSLLEQAKAMGGARVIHAQTRNRHNWSGHLACRGRHASTRGVAMPEKVPAK